MHKIKLAFCLDEGYAQHLAVTLASVFFHNRSNKPDVYIISPKLSESSVLGLQRIGELFNSNLFFKEIDTSSFDNLREDLHISKAAYFRLLLPDLLPELNKVIYLDCDLVVEADLSELWNVDTSNQAVAGWDEQSNDYVTRLDLKDNTYINSGVLVLNLEKWRTYSYGQNCLRWLRENPEKVFLHDQDAINVVLDSQKLKIDPKWNLNPVFNGQLKVLETYPSRILHFGGPIKPWHKCYDFQLQAIYKKYLSFTDWSESFVLIEPINTAQSISVANQYFETQDFNNAAKYYVTALDFWVKTKGAGSKLIIELINGGHRHYNSQDFFSACEYYRLVIEQLGFPIKYDVCIYRIPGLLDAMFNN